MEYFFFALLEHCMARKVIEKFIGIFHLKGHILYIQIQSDLYNVDHSNSKYRNRRKKCFMHICRLDISTKMAAMNKEINNITESRQSV